MSTYRDTSIQFIRPNCKERIEHMLAASTFFEDLSYVFVKCDASFVIKHCNSYCLTTSVGPNKNMIGQSLMDFFHAEDQADVKKQLERPQRTSKQRSVHRWRKADASYFWCEWQIIFDGDSENFYLMGEDISEQKRVESALKSLETVTDTGYWEIDLDTDYLYWSENIHKIHETDPVNFKPKLEDGLKFYHPSSVPTLIDALKILERTGKGYSKDLNFITSKGKDLIVNATGFSEIRHGRVVRNFGTFKDLTKQKQDEIILQRLEQRVVLALKAAKIGVWEFDLIADELIWDDRVFEIYGISRRSFSGKLQDWIGSLHPEDLKAAQQSFQNSVEERTHFDHKFRVVAENGEVRYVHGLAAFIYDENKNPIKATGVNIDLTESETIKNNLQATTKRAQANAKLAEEMAEKAKAADLQKSTFLANMSHEIRTPISGILGLIDLLLSEDKSNKLGLEKRQGYLNLMKNSSEHSLSIISDILDFSKIEAGKITINRESFDFINLTDHLISDFERRATEKNLTFEYQPSDLSDCTIISDPLRLKQILYNLLGNAVKFTPSGAIKLSIRLHQKSNDQAHIVCSVGDTGIGISDDKLGMLFQPFEQVDSSSARTSQGTGLGLSITHKLVELMNGSITVESVFGEGSTFTFDIPVGISQQSNINESYNDDINSERGNLLDNCKALVAEDNEINQVVIQSLLSQLGISCTLVENGEQALDSLVKHDPGYFNIILMDCQMPILDGFETTEVIRSDARFEKSKDIPIIALTANAMVGDREKCLRAGMNEYLSKPVSKAVLESKIAELLGIPTNV